MTTWGRFESKAENILISARGGLEREDSRSQENSPDTHCVGGWMGLQEMRTLYTPAVI
jgi:hypothetical protein